MFARVTITEGPPDKIDDAVRIAKETIYPAAKKTKGFKGMYVLVDRKTGKQMAFTLWDTEADLDASAESAKRLRAQYVQTANAQPAKVEKYEVAIHP